MSCVDWKALFIHSFTIHHSVISQQVVLLLRCSRVWSWFDPELRLDLMQCFACSPRVHSGLLWNLRFLPTAVLNCPWVWMSVWVCVCMLPCSGLVSLPGYNPPSQRSHYRLHIHNKPGLFQKALITVFSLLFPTVSMLLCEHADGNPGIINLHFVIYEGLAVRYPAVSGTAHSGVLWWREPEGMATSCCPLLHRAAVSVAPSMLGELD